MKKMATMGLANRIFLFMLFIAVLYILTLYFLNPAKDTEKGKGRKGGAKGGGGNMDDHESDEHTNLAEATDEMIIILGYKLHPDGMPTRLLRDRVAKGAEVYHEMMGNGHHPLIIVSGKGKAELGQTEAEAMHELSLCMGVRSGDILIDPDSTNTAQNAKFSAALIKSNKNAISEVYVVTSDYHLPRAQYIFQSVFPSDIQLDFVGSETPDARRKEEKPREKSLMKSSQEDLVREGILDTDDTTGYHPLRNLPRWRMIERELDLDARLRRVPANGDVVVADYGSNYGYFSLNMARKFPKGYVISLEGEAYEEYVGASKVHANKMKEEGVQNNLLCRTTIIPRMFTKLYDQSQVFHYQLCLSVFHWIPAMPTREDFEEGLGRHLMNSRTTFLELPEAMTYRDSQKDTQHAGEKINTWYAGRTETEILNDVAALFKLNMTHKFLGPILHENGTLRKVFRIDMLDMIPDIDTEQVLATVYKCQSTAGGKTNG